MYLEGLYDEFSGDGDGRQKAPPVDMDDELGALGASVRTVMIDAKGASCGAPR